MSDVEILHHKPTPPFPAVQVLTTVHNVDRVLPLDEAGTLSFSMASNQRAPYRDPVNTLVPPAVREGDAVSVWSTERLRPQLWLVDTVTDDAVAGTVTIDCVEWKQLLYRRIVPLAASPGGRTAAAVASILLAATNGRNPTFVREGNLSGGRLILADEELPLGGNSLGSALDELALRTDCEWWLEYVMPWGSAEIYLTWAERRGYDRTSRTRLDGYFLAESTYRRDQAETAQAEQVVGATDAIATAPAGTLVVSQVARSKTSLGGRVMAASEFERRFALGRNRGPGGTAEYAAALPSEESEISLLQTSLHRQRVPITATQSLEVQVRHPWPGSGEGLANTIGVPTLSLGDTILVVVPEAVFGVGVHIEGRILALQPDEASGLLGMVLEVQAGTLQWMRGL